MFFVSAVLLQPPAKATTNFERGKSRTNAHWQSQGQVRKRGEGSSTTCMWHMVPVRACNFPLLKIISSLSLFVKPTVTLALPVSNEFQHCAVLHGVGYVSYVGTTCYFTVFGFFCALCLPSGGMQRVRTGPVTDKVAPFPPLSESESLCQRGVESAT